MPPLRSTRREMFAQNIAKQPKTGKTITQCYLDAGYRGQGHGAQVNGSKLLSATDIKNRVAEILAPVVRKTRVSIESLLNELETTIGDARADGQHAVVVNALTLSAKLVGLLRDKIEVGGAGAFDRLETAEEVADKLLVDNEGDVSAVLSGLQELMTLVEDRAASQARVVS